MHRIPIGGEWLAHEAQGLAPAPAAEDEPIVIAHGPLIERLSVESLIELAGFCGVTVEELAKRCGR